MDEPGTAWTRPGNFVGNGPFALAAWRPGDGAVVKKNPYYWDAAGVRLLEIDFHFIDSPETEERAFRNGQLHVTVNLPRSKIETYRAPADSPLRTIPLYETDMIYLNLQKPPLDNPLVRQALSLAIDRAALGAQVMRDGSEPATSLLPDHAQGYSYQGKPRLRFDPAEARRLLASAGYADGRNFPKLEITCANDGIYVTVGEALQQMWRQHLGLEVALLRQERRVFVDNLHGHRYTVALAGWIGDYLDPMSFLDVFLATSGHNDPGYRNPGYDRLIAAAAGTADPAQRYALFSQAESQLMRDLPILPLYHRPNLHLVHPSVHGFEPNLMDMHPYQGMWLGNK
jgi:oligopeptide transport system substrate-binding protein